MRPPPHLNHPANLYDFIYHFKDHAADALRLRRVLLGSGVQDGARLLEVACGTGAYLKPLAAWYDVSGLDICPVMLEVARRKLPRVSLLQADMVDFTVTRPVDVVLALFGALGYLHRDEDLRAALDHIRAALKPGGLLLLEPWLTPDTFRPGEAYMQTFEAANFKLCRQCVAQREGDMARVDFHWLVARAGYGVEHFVEPLRMRLYTWEHLQQALAAAGLPVVQQEQGFMAENQLWVCRSAAAPRPA